MLKPLCLKLRYIHFKNNGNRMSGGFGKLKKSLLIVAGTLALSLGLIGIFFPILPTTPFLLLTAFCYMRSSQRLYAALLRNRLIGRYVTNYMQGRGMSLRMKLLTLSLLWLTLGCSVVLASNNLVIRIILLAVLVALLFILLCLETRRRGPCLPGNGISVRSSPPKSVYVTQSALGDRSCRQRAR